MPVGTALLAAIEAVALVKKGCALYKDIKSTAGNVKEIYDDINKQFSGKKVSKEQVVKIEEEKRRVQEVAKSDPNDVISQVGENLGKFFDAFDAIEALFWKEERAAKKVYVGDVSVSRRALNRVLIRSRLQAMYAEIRTEMTWNAPPELDDLWTRFQEMRDQVIKEQKVALLQQEKEEELARLKAVEDKRIFWDLMKYHFSWVSGVIFIIMYLYVLQYLIEQDRFWRWGE